MPSRRAAMRRMRYMAAERGKAVPSFEELEAVWTDVCRLCRRVMALPGSGGPRGLVASLQHWAPGEWSGGPFEIICHACNCWDSARRQGTFMGTNRYGFGLAESDPAPYSSPAPPPAGAVPRSRARGQVPAHPLTGVDGPSGADLPPGSLTLFLRSSKAKPGDRVAPSGQVTEAPPTPLGGCPVVGEAR